LSRSLKVRIGVDGMHTRVCVGMVGGGGGFDPFYVHYNKVSMTEHEGTHMDAPKHVLRDANVASDAKTIDQVDTCIVKLQ
jgi:hypothetical protein